ARCLQVGQRATEAESDAEDRADLTTVGATQVSDRRGDVGLELVGLRLWDLGHEVELVAAILGGRSAREEINADRVHADLRETVGQVLVVLVQAAHVGDDDHAGARRLGRARGVGHEPRAVRGRQAQVAAASRAAGDGGDRWTRVVVNAHAVILPGRKVSDTLISPRRVGNSPPCPPSRRDPLPPRYSLRREPGMRSVRSLTCPALVAIGLAACAAPVPTRDVAVRSEEIAPRFEAGGPDAETYQASTGYPKGDRFTYFRVPWLVGTQSHLDEIFEGRLIRKAPAPSRLTRVAEPPIRWTFEAV